MRGQWILRRSPVGSGRAALQHAVRAADGRGPATKLLTSILNFCQLSAPEALLAFVYQPFDKKVIAALAPLVLALAHEGDLIARHIEIQAADELARAVSTVARALGFPPGPLPLALGGGVLTHDEHLRDLILRRLARTWSNESTVVRGGNQR